MTETFWMVQGDGPSRVRHASRPLAEQEAQRLARANPGQEFFVMESVTLYRKVDVERVELRGDPDRLPF